MTELEAVNEIITRLGEPPVNAVNDTGIPEVDIALNTLRSTKKKVLSQGWNFNTKINQELIPDIEGHIHPPGNTLVIDAFDQTRMIRWDKEQNLLYDIVNKTYIFSEPEYVIIIEDHRFDDVPIHIAQYIMLRSAQACVSKFLAPTELFRVIASEVQEAKSEMNATEMRLKDISLLDGAVTWNIARKRRRRISYGSSI